LNIFRVAGNVWGRALNIIFSNGVVRSKWLGTTDLISALITYFMILGHILNPKPQQVIQSIKRLEF